MLPLACMQYTVRESTGLALGAKKVQYTGMSEDNTDEQIVTLNPVVGLSVEDLLDSATEVVKQGILQPAVALQHLGTLGVEITRVMLGKSKLEPHPKDRRFQAKGYQDNPVHSRTAKAWLAWQRALLEWVEDVGFDNEDDLARARFVVNLFADAMAPPNFLLGNPSAIEKAVETRGASLGAGLRNSRRCL